MHEYHYVTTNDCDAANGPCRSACQRSEDIRIKCRAYGAVSIPAETEVGTAFALVNTSVDCHGYQKPCVKVDFLSNILTDTATATLNFQVFRQCNGQTNAVPVSPVWTFSRAVATANEANSFGFAICDCDNCHCGSCDYQVVATVVGAATTGTVTLNNLTLITTIVEGADC